MPRPNPLSDPDFAKEVAEAFANGTTRAEMAECFAVTMQTITRWRKDPRVKRLVHTILVERVQRVSSKVDSIIEGRLQHAESMTIKELLDIRKEFVGDSMRGRLDEADSDTVNAAMQMADNPAVMDALQALMSGPLGSPEE